MKELESYISKVHEQGTLFENLTDENKMSIMMTSLRRKILNLTLQGKLTLDIQALKLAYMLLNKKSCCMLDAAWLHDVVYLHSVASAPLQYWSTTFHGGLKYFLVGGIFVIFY